jgi:hypothetical protein
VQVVDRVDRHQLEIEILEDAERDQRCDALSVRRDLVQRVAAVIEADRLHPVVLVRGEVVEAEHRAVLLCECRDLLGELSAVKGFPFGLRDALERFRLRGKGELLTGLGRTSSRQERIREAGLGLELRHLRSPQPRDRRRHHVTVGRVFDRGFEEIGKRKLPVLLRHRDPRAHRTRHRHRFPPARRHRRVLFEAVE